MANDPITNNSVGQRCKNLLAIFHSAPSYYNRIFCNENFQAKTKLGDAIDTYIREQISLAGEAISNTIKSKISNGDVILTYAL